MDAIVEELKAIGGLQYHEKRLLDGGDVAGCLSSMIARTRRGINLQIAALLVVACFPVVMLLIGLAVPGGSYRPHEYLAYYFSAVLAAGVGNLMAMLENSKQQVRLETLALLWRMSTVGEKPANRAA